jgi:hypothetical protein
MSEIVAEQIVAKVRTRLQAITMGNGYEFTTPGVIRPLRFSDDRIENLQIIVTVIGMPKNDALSYMGNPPVTARDLTVNCSCYGMPNESDFNSADYWRNQIFGAMSKALTTGAAWWNWDGLAINSSVGDPTPISEGSTGNVGVQLPVVITFRTDENNPFNLRA